MVLYLMKKLLTILMIKQKGNRLCNLQVVTQQENCRKSAKKRDYSFVANNHANRRGVIATNVDTKDEIYFKSMYAVQQKLGINVGTVKRVCEGIRYRKNGIFKIDDQCYSFQYFSK